MKIKVPDDSYLSLTTFEADLPDFTVLTGINGAGKSHLLESIYYRKTLIDNEILTRAHPVLGIQLKPTSERILISPIYFQSFQGRENFTGLNQASRNFTEDSPKRLETFRAKNKPQLARILDNFEQFKQAQKLNPNIGNESIQDLFFLSKIAKKLNKTVGQLEVKDIEDNFPLGGYSDSLYKIYDLFYKDYKIIFDRYYELWEENLERQYWFNEKGELVGEFFTDEEFYEEFGEPPWIILNKIIKEAKLGFSVDMPESLHKYKSSSFRLKNDINGQSLAIEKLSSGERVIMSLFFALYNATLELSPPKMLLMDEADASLHPSLTKQFLDIIENVFVKDKGIKVILSTHSPSTVALAPEESLYVMNKTAPRIEKTTKDKAIRILTEGVPSLSINYENRRQVFVESENDVVFYDKFYEKLKNKLIPEISLNFISSGESRTDKHGQKVSNCEQVINITHTLRDAGNKFIFGIIDWDNKNRSSNGVKVLGEGKRYNIESYIFDPILTSAFLLREKFVSRQDLGLNDDETYTNFKNFSVERLQVISNFITNKINTLVKSSDTSKVRVRYSTGKELVIPQWYLIHPGHSLEEQLKKAFAQLNKFHKEGELKKEIINKIVDDIPEFIPMDMLELFQSIQNT